MFDVLRNNDCVTGSEKIGKAKKIKLGFRVNIFNGNSLLLLKSKRFQERYEIYEIDGNLISKKRGFGRFINYANDWIEFDQSPNEKAYINLKENESFLLSELEKDCA